MRWWTPRTRLVSMRMRRILIFDEGSETLAGALALYCDVSPFLADGIFWLKDIVKLKYNNHTVVKQFKSTLHIVESIKMS